MIRRAGAFTLLPAAILLTGCAWFSSEPMPDPPAPEDCTGRYYLVVQNNSRWDAEIIQSSRDSGARNVIATLSPGRHEIDIPRQSGLYYYARRPRRTGRAEYNGPVGGPGSRQSFRSISVSPTCSEAAGKKKFGG